MKIPFVSLDREANSCKKDLISQFSKIIDSGIYINGPNVIDLEKKLQTYLDVEHVVSVGNGSDALTFILRALNISKGDEVICPSNSFIATAWSIVAVGATPVFCDVDDDLLIDLESLPSLLTHKTKAIMPVHLTGRVVDIDKITKIINGRNVHIIEDAAQSFGAADNFSRKTGSLGCAGAFSLHPLKNFAVYGDGGLVTTNNVQIANKVRLLRNHGLINRDESSIWGYNSRLDELQAAFALTKLKSIEQWTKKYIEIAYLYTCGIDERIAKPRFRNKHTDVYHNYVIRVSSKIRDKFRAILANLGVDTRVHYPIPIHLQGCSSELGYSYGSLPNCELFANQMISLPIYPFLSSEEVDYVIDSVNEAAEILLPLK